MDRLAERGTLFERAYCTNPVCLPSRFSMLTGRYPSELDLRSNDFDHLDEIPDEITQHGLGHRLRNAGYETVYGGKEHLPKMSVEDLGFSRLTENRREGLATSCIDYLSSEPDQPFCLVASFINPHDICFMAIRDYKRSRGEWTGRGEPERRLDEALSLPIGVDWRECCPSLPDNHKPQRDEPTAIDRLLDENPFRRYVREEWDEKRWRLHRRAYCRLTEMVDAHIQQILDAIETYYRLENTAVIFLSDHGDHDAAHQLEHKNIPYEEATRVPLIIDPPDFGVASRTDTDHLVSIGLDLLPTLCDYAGVAPPVHCNGENLRQITAGREPAEWRSHLRIESEVGEAVVTDRYKLVRYGDGANHDQLYDLDRDPGETENALPSDEYEAVAQDLRSQLTWTTEE